MNKDVDIKAILFNMDGTITDTELVGFETLDQLLNTLNVKLSDDEWNLFDKVWRRDGSDMSFEEFVNEIFVKHQLKISKEEFIVNFYKNYEQGIIKAKLLPGAKKLLKKLQNKYKLALVTASTKPQAEAVIRQNKLNNIFDTIIAFEEYKIKKPNPAAFLLAAKRLKIPPRQCVVVEDSKNGVLAGKNAGMYVVGVRAGNKILQDLSNADEVAGTLENIRINF